ncbi:hypothetical protein EUTSA_v10023881mg [Eutrema salsugineum]|uniref:Retrotransposon gag domain-containing protein n=1 Tax=Eutrema salsugineum TaxID=72664 RepID=V4KQR9_EUTSA|nr:hypothetical protein EUTSA_v10023881mg [Eutrema salsugineum]
MEKLVFDELERAKQNTIERDIWFAKFEETVMGAVQILKDNIGEILNSLGEVHEDLVLCKHAAANGGAGITETIAARVEFQRPAWFKGVRDAQEVENFLWEMEQSFENLGLTYEGSKIKTATSYLAEMAMLWWRRRHAEIVRGIVRIDTWDKFKRDLKRQFYPENVVYQVRKKLRELHQKGTIRDYVMEFTALLLQIPSTSEDDSVFYFIDGLQPWAKQELQRRGVYSVNEAIAAAESLSDFSIPDRPKSYERQGWYPAKGGREDRSSQPVSPRGNDCGYIARSSESNQHSRLASPRGSECGSHYTSGKGSYSKADGMSSSREYERRKRSFTLKGGCHV